MTQLLVMITGAVLAVTAFNIAVIFIWPPRFDLPVSAYEAARLLKGQPVAKIVPGVAVTQSATAPNSPPAAGNVIVRAIARDLPAGTALRFENGPFPSQYKWLEPVMTRENALYGNDPQYTPSIFGSFTVAARLPDGTWRIVHKDAVESTWSWQSRTALMLIGMFVLVVSTAWLFSRRFQTPIAAVANAVDRLGRRKTVSDLALVGPIEIRAAAASVNALKERLNRFLEERTSVVGAVAHDLRTPLARLQFHLDAAPAPVRVKAEREIAEMQTMISSAIDFVEGENRRLTRDPVDLSLLVEGVVDDLSDLGKDVRLDRSAAAVVSADPVMLKRMFVNLLNNAVTYGGSARVKLRTEGDVVIVDVLDEGPGMAPADLERAFGAFYRAEGSRNRATGGIGLGLAIVKSVAEAHGGTVRLSNCEPTGLHAEVRLPLACG